MQADDSEDQAPEQVENSTAKPPETQPGDGSAGRVTLGSPLIVVVDDDPEFGEQMSAYFKTKGIRVQTFISRVEVLEWSWTEKPVLFVVDQNLGGEDGRSLALDLRDHGKLGDCPMVLITEAEMDFHNKDFTLKLGFRKIVSKPFAFDVLERIIADEPRARAEMLKSDAADKQVDQQAFEERKAAVLKKMGLGEEAPTGEESAEEQIVPPVGGGPVTRKVQITTSVVPKAKTTSVAVHPGAKPGAVGLGTALHWVKGLLLGLLFPIVLVAIRAYLVPAGYATPLVAVEGAVLGLFLGLGLSIGLRRLPAPPELVPVAISVLLLSLAVWGLSVHLRCVRNIDFVEYSVAARAHLKDPGRRWGLSEWFALAYNLAGGLLTFAGGMFVMRSLYMKMERAALALRAARSRFQ